MKPPAIVWFRQDLRLADNPALLAAASTTPVLAVYIDDDCNGGRWRAGAASRCWLHHSLRQLDASLQQRLQIYRGDPLTILRRLLQDTGASTVHWNRCYAPWQIDRDRIIKQALSDDGYAVQSHAGNLLWEPWTIAKADGKPYRVFTPFYRKGCLQAPPPRPPLDQPESLALVPRRADAMTVEDLDLLPTPAWDRPLYAHWEIGEAGARRRLQEFVEQGLRGYRDGRDLPSTQQVSRLSPHLHFGELSPHSVWHAATGAGLAQGCEQDLERFQTELGWREFSHHLLYHQPDLPESNLDRRFDAFPWRDDGDAELRAWQQGRTGYPIVDAGMRELWQTGYMHNRVRMIVASFLVKNLLIDWRRGADWFWDCLFDADLANNSASWQWVAGCGADAAPYFRIFNPVLQGQRFDSQGAYVRRYVPEIAALPDKYLHCPWDAPADLLDQAGIVLGRDYPEPVVALKASRQRALDAFAEMKSS